MKFLRHPPTMFWALVVLVLGAVLAAGALSGSSESNVRVYEPRPEDEAPYVTAMLTRISQVRSVTEVLPEEINEWGADTAAMALENTKRRALAAGGDDPVALAYAAIALDAEQLAQTDEENADDVLEARARLGIDHDRLIVAASGSEVPGLPDSPIRIEVNPDSKLSDITIITEEAK